MKLNKTMGRVATTLVATAMLASLAAPAYAATAMTGGKIDNTDTNTAVDGTVTFTKNYSMPANVAIPNIDFTFTVSAPATVNETRTEDGHSVKVEPGKGTITGDTVVPTDFGGETYNADRTVKTYTATVELQLPDVEAFATDGPGIYKYEVTETAYNHGSTTVQYTADDLKMAGVHDLYLFVERTNDTTELKITGVEFSDKNNTKTDSWNNFYKLDITDPDNPDPDPDPMDNELTVTKTVNGDMGNRSQKFDFTVSINGDGTEAYTINYIGSDGSVTGAAPAFEYDSGKWTTTIQLAHGESARVYGLSNGDVYNIKEDPKYATEGYQVAYSADSNDNATDGADGTFSTNATITTTNTRDAVSPTGIVMNVAPYALLVVVAAAGCFVFMRKRRED